MLKINNIEVEKKRFPNGELHIEINEDLYNSIIDLDRVVYMLKYEDESDLILLMLCKKKLDSELNKKSILRIAYMPYSRMDRVKNRSDVFTLKYICEFINNLKFTEVYVSEAHSDVTLALLDNVKHINVTEGLFRRYFKDYSKDDIVLCFPDSGAQKRYAIPGYRSIVGFKERDWETGKIKSLKLTGDDVSGKTVIIMDDLCSFGGTFKLAADELKKLGAAKIILIVAHCEENIFKGDLLTKKSHISSVFTTNSILANKDLEWFNGKELFIDDIFSFLI